MKNSKLLLNVAYSVLIIASSAFAHTYANAQSEQKQVENQKDTKRDIIIISAGRRQEKLLDAPVSASVLNTQFIENARINSVRQIDEFIPNVQFNQSGQIGGTFISIRGIESNPYIVNRATVYIDGIPYRNLDNSTLPTIKQIEVLRGPQGTLYGANTESGLIIIQTEAPSGTPHAEGNLSYYNFKNGNGAEASAKISGPLTDTIKASLVAKYENADSFVKNIASSINESGKIKQTYAQGRIRWEPKDNLNIDLVGSITNRNASGLYELEFVPLNTDLYNNIYYGMLKSQKVSAHERANDSPGGTKDNFSNLAVSGTYYFDFAKLDFNASINREISTSKGLDLDLTSMPYGAGGNQTRSREFNTEARISSLSSSKIQWVIGVNAYDQAHRGRLSTLLGPGNLDSYQYAPWQYKDGNGIAIFGQAKIPVTDNINITGGIRYDWAHREIKQTEGVLDLGQLGSFFYAEETNDADYKMALPKISIDWKPAKNIMLYSSISKGWIPGGFNLQASVPTLGKRFASYQPESLVNFEAGFKAELLERKLFLSGAVFHINAKNWQEYVVPTNDSGVTLSTTVITSDAEVRNNGFELEMTAKPNPNLDFAIGFGYVDAKYKTYKYDDTRDYSGNRVKLTPKWDLSASSTWRPWKGLFLHAEANATGDNMLNSENTVKQDSVVIFNAQIGWETDKWSIKLYGDNIGNELYYSSTAYDNFMFGKDGVYYLSPENPRVIGIELSTKW